MPTRAGDRPADNSIWEPALWFGEKEILEIDAVAPDEDHAALETGNPGTGRQRVAGKWQLMIVCATLCPSWHMLLQWT